MLYAPPYLQKANALGYKTAKRRIAMELRDMITAILIVFAGEILQRFTKLKLIKIIGKFTIPITTSGVSCTLCSVCL